MKIFKYILLTVLLTASILVNEAYSAVPWNKYSYFSNVGGLNDNSSTLEIQDNEATDLQNVVFDVGGAVKKRFGYNTVPKSPVSKVSTGTSQVITGLSFFKRDNASRSIVTIVNNDNHAMAYSKIYDTGGGLANTGWDNISTASYLVSTGYTDNDLVNFTIAQDLLVFTTSATTPVKPFQYAMTASVSTLTPDANCPTASLCCYHKNHLVLSGNTSFPSRVYFSNLGDIFTWTTTDFLNVETSDGTKVRALISAFDSLYIFKDNSIWRLSGTNRDDFVLQKMVPNIGTLSFNSVKVVNNVIYFVTAQGDIAAYDGGYNVVFLSDKIRNTIGGLNFQRSLYAIGAAFSTYRYNDYDYYCAVSGAGKSQNDTILFFDTQKKAWSKFVGLNSNAMCVGENAVGQNILFFGDYSGYIHTYPSTSYYDGDVLTSSINSFYQTKWYRYPELALSNKIWRRCKPYCISESAGSTLNIECKTDYELTGSIFTMDLGFGSALWDSAIFDQAIWGGQSLITKTLEVERGNNIFQIKFSNTNLNEGYTILGWENFIEPTTGGI